MILTRRWLLIKRHFDISMLIFFKRMIDNWIILLYSNWYFHFHTLHWISIYGNLFSRTIVSHKMLTVSSKLRITGTLGDRERISIYAKIRHSRCSHDDVIFWVGKSVPRTTFEVCDKLRYTEPSYAELTVIIVRVTLSYKIMSSSMVIWNG